MLSGEEEQVRRIHTEFGECIASGETLLKICSLFAECDLSHLSTEFLSANSTSLSLGHGLVAKACKLFRQSHACFLIGGNDTIQIQARTLFEAAMATKFIVGELDEEKKPSEYSHGIPSQETRAKMYLASHIKKQAYVLKKCGRPEDEDRKKSLEALEKELGEVLWRLLSNHPYSYSGLSVAKLAKWLDPNSESLAFYHQIAYGEQSTAIHAADAFKHLTATSVEHVKWQDPLNDILDHYSFCAQMLVYAVIQFGERFGVGGNMGAPMYEQLEILASRARELEN